MLVAAQRKRLCSSLDEEHENLPCREAGRQKPGCDLARDCTAWLQQHGLLALAQQHPSPQQFQVPQFWWALAELNITLAAWTHLFHEQRLLESHNFTRCPKALAFEKLCFARGCADVPSVQQHPHLQAVSLVLDTALAGCSEAAISQVTLRCPPFLQGWAQRWLKPNGLVRLMVVQGYRSHSGPLRAATCYNLGLPTITSTPAATTVYMPCG